MEADKENEFLNDSINSEYSLSAQISNLRRDLVIEHRIRKEYQYAFVSIYYGVKNLQSRIEELEKENKELEGILCRYHKSVIETFNEIDLDTEEIVPVKRKSFHERVEEETRKMNNNSVGYTKIANHAVTINTQEVQIEQLKNKIELLESVVEKADEMEKTFIKLLEGLATDGMAIEGFTDGWKVVTDYLNTKLVKAYL